ncbi:MAG: 23S rRNA (cytidine(2498)-2'-O)-methyltransferase RlmM [Oceanisphaera sp.]|uniref:23S rRNA (cytidine(2498)-2'-O)-methyltransferase RlmM n=1 Tax=Oceanisphaera sp. TaxID=1929979 RepID=UPI003F9753A5
MKQLLIYCRPGFEKEAAAEIQDRAGQFGSPGFARTKDDSGFVIYECFSPDDADLMARKLLFRELIFARQMVVVQAEVKELSLDDRISPILDAAESMELCGDLRVETPDTNDGKELSRFCRKFTVPMRQALRAKGLLTDKEVRNRPILHLFFLANNHALIGYSYSFNNSPFHMGIPRLRFPSDAPSRSTLKLEEAFHVFIPREEWEMRLTSGLNAVDLGAAPGGWTYQLVSRGMMVTAVDNGAMDSKLMDTGQVKHYREDVFSWRPGRKNVYWLVCDMVEKPARVAATMAAWLVDEDCQEAIFNLKLPMKKRYAEAVHNLQQLKEKLAELGGFHVQAKQLYHDREEITVHVYRPFKVARLIPKE